MGTAVLGSLGSQTVTRCVYVLCELWEGQEGLCAPQLPQTLKKGRGEAELNKKSTCLRFAMALQTVNVSVVNFHICKLEIVTDSALMLVKITGANRYKALGRALRKNGSCPHCVIMIIPSSQERWR